MAGAGLPVDPAPLIGQRVDVRPAEGTVAAQQRVGLRLKVDSARDQRPAKAGRAAWETVIRDQAAGREVPPGLESIVPLVRELRVAIPTVMVGRALVVPVVRQVRDRRVVLVIGPAVKAVRRRVVHRSATAAVSGRPPSLALLRAARESVPMHRGVYARTVRGRYRVVSGSRVDRVHRLVRHVPPLRCSGNVKNTSLINRAEQVARVNKHGSMPAGSAPPNSPLPNSPMPPLRARQHQLVSRHRRPPCGRATNELCPNT